MFERDKTQRFLGSGYAYQSGISAKDKRIPGLDVLNINIWLRLLNNSLHKVLQGSDVEVTYSILFYSQFLLRLIMIITK